MSSCYTIDIEKKLKYYLNSWSELGNIYCNQVDSRLWYQKCKSIVLFLILDDMIKEQSSPVCLLKTNFHIANISKNISHVLHEISDISLLSKNVLLEIMSKLKSNIQFG